MKNKYRGFTAYICFGEYAGFGIRPDGPALRIVLGRVAICFLLRDMELQIRELMRQAEKNDTVIEVYHPCSRHSMYFRDEVVADAYMAQQSITQGLTKTTRHIY